MNVRFDLHGDDHEDLCALVNLLDDEQGFPLFLVRVRLKDGREVFGQYESLRSDVFVLANPWPRDGEGGHGWAPGAKGLVVDPRHVQWLEYISESSPEFRDPEAHPAALTVEPAGARAEGPAATEAASLAPAPAARSTPVASPQQRGRLHKCEDEVTQAWTAVEAAVVAAAVEAVEAPDSPEARERLRLAVGAMLAVQAFVEELRTR